MGDGLRVGGPINEKNRGELGLTQELETFQAYFWGDNAGADAAGRTVLSRLALGPAGVLPSAHFLVFPLSVGWSSPPQKGLQAEPPGNPQRRAARSQPQSLDLPHRKSMPAPGFSEDFHPDP